MSLYVYEQIFEGGREGLATLLDAIKVGSPVGPVFLLSLAHTMQHYV